MEYQLDLQENAIDSFNEALAKYELGQREENCGNINLLSCICHIFLSWC